MEASMILETFHGKKSAGLWLLVDVAVEEACTMHNCGVEAW